ncbi:hypothetical protein UPYG_G00094700 [Umbra pygmaea]|uniref:CLEC16A/TT9 C-terminal domain-containing protein n=1 Tax=Umbra pygmaea TaxID=75934 RepID=A0ABD0XHI8_UMBPY
MRACALSPSLLSPWSDLWSCRATGGTSGPRNGPTTRTWGRRRRRRGPGEQRSRRGREREKGKGTGGGCRTSGEMEEIEMVVMEKCKMSSTLTEQNITDEEKTAAAAHTHTNRPFLDMMYSALDCSEDDYHALFVLCLLYAVSHSKGINSELLQRLQLPVPHQEKTSYSQVLVERLIRVMNVSSQPGNTHTDTQTHTLMQVMNVSSQPDGKVRLATLELSCLLMKQSVLSSSSSSSPRCIIKDVHLACLEGEEIFLDMFEDEYRSMTSKPLNVEYLMMDASVLLPPTGTPLTGIDFVKRLPCGDVEKTRRAIRVFFMLRSLSLQLQGEPETQLPLTRPEDLIKTDDVLDLNNSDLIACMVVSKEGGQAQRFLSVDVYQMSLVEPDSKRLGWGVVKFAGLLQDMQVSGVEDDSRALNIIIHKPSSNPHSKPLPILQANFIFADHIRCIIAKQRLAKGRIQARRMKMQRIAALLDLPVQPSSSEVLGFGQSGNTASGGQLPFRFYDQSRRGPNDPTAQRPVFASVDKVPGFAVAHCVPQHSPSPLSSPSSGSGSTGRCDSVTASTISANSPADDGTFLEITPPSSSGGEGEGGGGDLTGSSPPLLATPHSLTLAPSLTPASQPNISLLTDDHTDALSVESLTLLPPADPPHLHTLGSHTHLLTRGHAHLSVDMAIREEEEEGDEVKMDAGADAVIQGTAEREIETLNEQDTPPEGDTPLSLDAVTARHTHPKEDTPTDTLEQQPE